MNIGMIVAAIAILWSFAIFLMAFSLWTERRKERRQEKERREKYAQRQEDVIRLSEYRNVR